MTEKNYKSFYAHGGQSYWSITGKRWQNSHTKTETRGDTVYEASFNYEEFKTQIALDAKKNADYADWLVYIDRCEQAKKQISQSNESGEKKTEERKKIDNVKPDLNQGEYNKLFEKIKDIETNIQKTIPEKVKDMKEVMAQIEEKNKEITANMDDKLDKLQDEHNSLAQKYKAELEKGNKAAASIILAKMKEVDSAISEIAEAKDKLTGSQWIQDFLEGERAEANKWFWQKMDWKSSRTYVKLSLATVALIAIILLVIWIIRKIKSFF